MKIAFNFIKFNKLLMNKEPLNILNYYCLFKSKVKSYFVK